MDKVKQFFTDFIKTRKITYYIALGVAFIAFIMGIVATASLADAGATALPLVFTLIGLLAFAGLSVIGLEKIGAGLVSFASFGALVATVCEVYEYFHDAITNQAMGGFNVFAIEGVSALLACVILLVICAVVANVLAWLKLKKENAPADKAAEGEVKNEN